VILFSSVGRTRENVLREGSETMGNARLSFLQRGLKGKRKHPAKRDGRAESMAIILTGMGGTS